MVCLNYAPILKIQGKHLFPMGLVVLLLVEL